MNMTIKPKIKVPFIVTMEIFGVTAMMQEISPICIKYKKLDAEQHTQCECIDMKIREMCVFPPGRIHTKPLGLERALMLCWEYLNF